ncbi:MFS transporter [Hyperthermus butylicus]|uniref:Universally conserved protein n=1 Tax=Hyperthermus butylicus (strain DSM 5456 / JCM 9403 / PLM1-5) TaxID=415426 RepID=A2BKY2_HYPBU|nr:MFS transporter [Hyperthermus butylicus]ABM80643.1 universally conserved protein [Hyperthermus butylicus DSM 5456]
MRRLYLLLVLVFSHFMAVSMLNSVIARYMRDTGLSVTVSGWIIAITPLVAAALRLPVGSLADRYGAKPLLALGVATGAVAAVLAARAKSLTDFLAVRMLQGIANAFFIGPSIYAAVVFSEGRAAHGIAYRSATLNAATVAGPVTAGILVDNVGYYAAFTAASLVALVGAAISTSLPSLRVQGSSGGERRVSAWSLLVENPVLLLATSLALVDGVAFFTMASIVQMHFRDAGYSATAYGMYQALLAATAFISRLSSGRLYSRYPAWLLLTIGYILETISFTVLVAGMGSYLAYLAAPLYGFGSGLCIPGHQLLASTSVPPSLGNRAIGVYVLGFDLGGALGLFVVSKIAGSYGYTAAYGAIAILTTIAMMQALRARRIVVTKPQN